MNAADVFVLLSNSNGYGSDRNNRNDKHNINNKKKSNSTQ